MVNFKYCKIHEYGRENVSVIWLPVYCLMGYLVAVCNSAEININVLNYASMHVGG